MNKRKRHNEYFAVLFALILAAVLASGCSTPAQTGNLYEGETPAMTSYSSYGSGSYGSSSAAQSYLQCVNVLTQYGVQQQCYQVSSPYATSYPQYTYSKTGFAKGLGDEMKAQAYAAYLSSLDDQAAADLKAQYDALVAQYSE
jgi:hypothetical protein